MTPWVNNTQQALADAIFGHTDGAQFDVRGLEAYRRNLVASAARALEVSYPTIRLLLGEDLLKRFAGQFLRQHGRRVSDWGMWGAEFPAWLRAHPMSQEHPYLQDVARLDWAVHQCDRAADAIVDADSLSTLASQDIYSVTLSFAPGARLVRSSFPIVDIYCAHQQRPDNPDLSAVPEKLRQGVGQTALIWRQGWRSMVREPVPEEMALLALLDSPGSLGEALDASSATAASLPTWLPSAIEAQLVTGISNINH